MPCYSSLANALTPPPIPASLTAKPTTGAAASGTQAAAAVSTVVNVVYAMQYPVTVSTQSDGLPLAAKAGIGAGAGVAGLGLLALILCLVRMLRKRKHDKAVIANLQATSASTPAMSQGQPQQQMYQPSPGQYSAQTNQDPRQSMVPTMASYSPQPGFNAPSAQYGGPPPMAAGAAAGGYFAPNNGNGPQQYGQPQQQQYGQQQQYEPFRTSAMSGNSQPTLPTSPGSVSMAGSNGYSPSQGSTQAMLVSPHGQGQHSPGVGQGQPPMYGHNLAPQGYAQNGPGPEGRHEL